MTTGEIVAHFDEVYGAKVFKDAISQIAEKVSGELAEWSSRPLDPLYPVIFVDAIVVKVGDGQVRNTPFYVVMGVTVNGKRDILGIWAGDGQEGARFWLQVFTEVKNRGRGCAHRGLRRAEGVFRRRSTPLGSKRSSSSASST
nr:transposase [Schaalia cardiffensis]